MQGNAGLGDRGLVLNTTLGLVDKLASIYDTLKVESAGCSVHSCRLSTRSGPQIPSPAVEADHPGGGEVSGAGAGAGDV